MNRRHRLFLWPALAFWGCTAHVDAPRARDLATTTSTPAQPTTSEAAVASPPATVVVESLPETTVPSTAAIGRGSTTLVTVPAPAADEGWMACVRAHESDTSGGYSAVSPDGTYRGAYQDDQRTWDESVAAAGYPEYVGTPANLAPPAVQDAAAIALHAARGMQPWAGSGC